jgi:hypothetical protein
VMDCVESCVEGSIVYSWKEEPRTYRQILHEYTAGFPWSQEGPRISRCTCELYRQGTWW